MNLLKYPKFSADDKKEISKAVMVAVLSALIIKTIEWGFDIYTAAYDKHKERNGT